MRNPLKTIVLLFALPGWLAAQPVDLLQRPRQAEKTRNYDVLNYRLVFKFDLPSKSFQGENTVTLKPLQDGFTRCILDAEDFTVTEVVDGRGGRLAFSQTEKELAVDLAAPAPYGLPLSFVVRFFMKDPKTGLKFIEASPRHPAQINTYSWPEDAHHWFPCNDYPNDKATDDMTVTVPAGFKAISNGSLIETVEDDRAGTVTYRWSQDRPHPVYGIMIAAGPYEIIRDSLGKLPVDYWVYPKDAANAPRSFHKTPRMIEFYEKTFGVPYPWAKYDQVCVAGYGGGMEATTATILGDATIHDDRAEPDFPSDGLVAHELAHMWWGDFVTPRRWTDVWISESFATYSEYLFSRFDRGEDEGALNLEDKKNQYLEEARTRYIRPIVFDRYNQPWEIMDGHSYPKGAAVLHMLRFVMGDGPFFTVLRHFLDKFAYGVADTHDFAVAIKEATGQNLDGFLEQWLDHPGHPVFEVSSAWDASAGKLKVTINQIQDFSRGIPVYRMPVAIGIVEGRSRVSRKVRIEGKSQVFEFPCPSKPLDVIFDDGHHLLKELIFPKDFEELAFEIKNADAVGRMRAAVEIGNHPLGLPVLIAVSKADPFWAVRRSAIETLGGLGQSVDIGVFKAGCGDPDSRVRAASVRALSLKPGFSAPADYFKALFRRDSSYVVQAAALKALGACGRLKDIPFLEEALRIDSPRELVKKSAARAIEEIRTAGKAR